MKAMVFAAGLGTRLRPLTDHKPKALVEVGGVPMLRRVLERLRDAGIREVVVNVHHFPDMIIDYIRCNDGFGLDILISDERDLLLDTGGAIVKAAGLIGEEPVLVHNADILTDFSLTDMIAVHKASMADVTLLAQRRSTSRYLLFEEDMRMCGWCNTATGEVRPEGLSVQGLSPLAFGGVHILSPRAVKTLCGYAGAGMPFSITPFYIDRCGSLDIRAYTPSVPFRWFDIGKPDTLAMAERAMQ